MVNTPWCIIKGCSIFDSSNVSLWNDKVLVCGLWTKVSLPYIFPILEDGYQGRDFQACKIFHRTIIFLGIVFNFFLLKMKKTLSWTVVYMELFRQPPCTQSFCPPLYAIRDLRIRLHLSFRLSGFDFRTLIPEWNELGSCYLAHWCIPSRPCLGLLTDFLDLYLT